MFIHAIQISNQKEHHPVERCLNYLCKQVQRIE